MANLASKVFSGIGIISTGVGLQIQDKETQNNILLINTVKPFVTISSRLMITDSVIIDDLSVNTIVIGIPSNPKPELLLHIYDNIFFKGATSGGSFPKR